MGDTDAIKKGLEAYQAGVDKSLAKFPERKKEFTTVSKAPVARLYTPLDNAKQDYLRT